MGNLPFVHSTGEAGPVLFCLHGLLGSGAQFSGLSVLTDRYRIAAWDAPGYGKSPRQASDPPLESYVDQAASAIEALGNRPVHVLGTGWGGLIAMGLAASRQDLVRSLIVADSCLGPGADRRTGLEKVADQVDEVGVADFARKRVDALVAPAAAEPSRAALAEVATDGLTEGGVADAVRSLRDVSLAARLRGLQLPTLVVAGEDAPGEAVQDSQDVSAAIADAVFVTMHEAGGLAHLEQPVTFAAWVRSFLYIVDQVREATR